VRQQDAYPTNAEGTVTTTCTPTLPFSRATFPSLLASIYLTQGIENGVSTSPPLTLIFDRLTPEIDLHVLVPLEDLCQFTLKSVNLFLKYTVQNLVSDERTNRRTDEGTGREHYAFGQSVLVY